MNEWKAVSHGLSRAFELSGLSFGCHQAYCLPSTRVLSQHGSDFAPAACGEMGPLQSAEQEMLQWTSSTLIWKARMEHRWQQQHLGGGAADADRRGILVKNREQQAGPRSEDIDWYVYCIFMYLCMLILSFVSFVFFLSFFLSFVFFLACLLAY